MLPFYAILLWVACLGAVPLIEKEAFQTIWDWDSVYQEELSRSDQVLKAKRFFNDVLGLKWCGPGNSSKNENDLGVFRDTDKCCRDHDMCPNIIEAGQTKHSLTNPSYFTRLNCECDEELRKCLKSVGSIVSTGVGYVYFTVAASLGRQCYSEKHPVVSCRKYVHRVLKKCVEYELDETKDKVYQWFDLADY